jgi:hypothetical protein
MFEMFGLLECRLNIGNPEILSAFFDALESEGAQLFLMNA